MGNAEQYALSRTGWFSTGSPRNFF